MLKPILGWLCFWWIPLVGIEWDGSRWLQGTEEIPEYVLVGGAMIAIVAEVATVLALTLTLL